MSNSVVYIASLSYRLDAFADSVSAIKRQKHHHKDRVSQTQTHNDQAIRHVINCDTNFL